MFNFFKNTAVIIRQDADDNVEVSPDFETVAKANHGLAAHVALTGGVVVSADVNDHDGKVLTVLQRESAKRWQEVGYEVLPTSELEG